ncbi:aminoacyl-tRNA hydrolase [Fibrobacterota bacterium]
MKIIVGLGNPGKKYQDTPHNVGFSLIDGLAVSSVWKRKGKSAIQQVNLDDFPVILAKPTTYMNLSGEAVRSLISYYKLAQEDLIVVVDDANLDLGIVRIRRRGSDGGHKGLQSIIQYCGTEFTRIRIGVGKCPIDMDLSDFVLRKLKRNDARVIRQIKGHFKEIITEGLRHGWEKAASKYNKSYFS